MLKGTKWYKHLFDAIWNSYWKAGGKPFKNQDVCLAAVLYDLRRFTENSGGDLDRAFYIARQIEINQLKAELEWLENPSAPLPEIDWGESFDHVVKAVRENAKT